MPTFTSEPPLPPAAPPSWIVPLTVVERLLPPTVSWSAPRKNCPRARDGAGRDRPVAGRACRGRKVHEADPKVGNGSAGARAVALEENSSRVVEDDGAARGKALKVRVPVGKLLKQP